ncbi:unnamed protein product [Parnassius apollo]|uniref:(apollo) hypothetical protein n=1 Tax=Parnassius apollo TaxID=110799 RepID=A0A8S3XJ58_PARAO|nr:unnamed protein product [Parnassius apollo]
MYTCVSIVTAAQRHGSRPTKAQRLAAVSREYAVPSRLGTSLSHLTFHITYPCCPPDLEDCGEARRSPTERPCCFSRYVRVAARTTFAVVNNLYCVPAYVVWMMALRLVRPFFAPVYWRIEGLMYHWLLAMVSLWAWTAGYESKFTNIATV